MRIFIRILIAFVFAAASSAYGVTPLINVSVSDSSGHAAYEGVTNTSGTFATRTLQPGNYIVQFRSATTPNGSRYAVVVSAGNKKVSANAIAAEKLTGGGVAVKIAVGSGLNIVGKVTVEDKDSAPMGHNGKPMVWIPRKMGSNLAAHWAESDSAEAREVATQSSLSTKNLQDRQNQGITPNQGGDLLRGGR